MPLKGAIWECILIIEIIEWVVFDRILPIYFMITSNEPYPQKKLKLKEQQTGWDEFCFRFKTLHEIPSWRHYFLNALHKRVSSYHSAVP
jgi:hypothetical protein